MPDVEKDAADRLMGQVRYNARNCEPPTPAQVGAVLHALADFTAINRALSYQPDPDEPGPHGGKATSLGRWYHAVGDVLDRDFPPGTGDTND